MGALHRSPRIRFKGTRANRGLIAVLALTGAPKDELRTAVAWARAAGHALLRVAVDGGLHSWRSLRVSPDLYVGDADSACPPEGLEAVVYPRDKDFSDLAGALGEARGRGAHVVCIAGLTGGRLDHEWANLHELAARSRYFAGIAAPTPRGWVVLTSRGATIETRPGATFSLLAVGGRARVDLRGAEWTLRDSGLKPGSRGLSNVSGKRLTLAVSSGTACLVFPDR